MGYNRGDFAVMIKSSHFPGMLSTRAASFWLAMLFPGLLAQFGCNNSNETANADVIGQRIEFKSGSNSERYRVSGWSAAEPNFTWSEGTSAKVALPIGANAGALTLKLTTAALIKGPELPFQPVEVYANGKKIADWQVGDVAEFSATIPADMTTDTRALTIEFRTPKAVSPKSLGLNSDTRALGICVHSLELVKIQP
jgi:hypothetical protein